MGDEAIIALAWFASCIVGIITSTGWMIDNIVSLRIANQTQNVVGGILSRGYVLTGLFGIIYFMSGMAILSLIFASVENRMIPARLFLVIGNITVTSIFVALWINKRIALRDVDEIP